MSSPPSGLRAKIRPSMTVDCTDPSLRQLRPKFMRETRHVNHGSHSLERTDTWLRPAGPVTGRRSFQSSGSQSGRMFIHRPSGCSSASAAITAAHTPSELIAEEIPSARQEPSRVDPAPGPRLADRGRHLHANRQRHERWRPPAVIVRRDSGPHTFSSLLAAAALLPARAARRGRCRPSLPLGQASQRRQTRNDVRPQAAAVSAGRRRIWLRPATPGNRPELLWEQEDAGSNPAIPTMCDVSGHRRQVSRDMVDSWIPSRAWAGVEDRDLALRDLAPKWLARCGVVVEDVLGVVLVQAGEYPAGVLSFAAQQFPHWLVGLVGGDEHPRC